MTALRFLGNLLLALVLIVLIALVLFGAYGVVSSRVWELFGLDYAVDGGEWLWIDEQPIYYRMSGNEKGDWLVLVHGFQVEGSETWAANAQTLAKWGMHVVEVDLRGYGHSVRDTSPQVYSAMEQAYLSGVGERATAVCETARAHRADDRRRDRCGLAPCGQRALPGTGCRMDDGRWGATLGG